jgi:hypothetical protein
LRANGFRTSSVQIALRERCDHCVDRTVGLDNYEPAIETYAAYLTGLLQVDASRIGMFGISTSGC